MTSKHLKLILSLYSSRFDTWPKKLRQKLKYLQNEKSFWGEIKRFFIIFKGISVVKNCLRRVSAPLKQLLLTKMMIDRFSLEDTFKELNFGIKKKTVHKKCPKSAQKKDTRSFFILLVVMSITRFIVSFPWYLVLLLMMQKDFLKFLTTFFNSKRTN